MGARSRGCRVSHSDMPGYVASRGGIAVAHRMVGLLLSSVLGGLLGILSVPLVACRLDRFGGYVVS